MALQPLIIPSVRLLVVGGIGGHLQQQRTVAVGAQQPVDALRNIFSKIKDRKKARKALHRWYKNVGKTRIREIISVRDTIKGKEEYILNYFNNRSTNASAESFNSKVKGLRAQVHGVNDLPFFMFRCAKIFG